MGKLIEFETKHSNATGYLALPPQGKGPGLLLMHAWWGLNDFFVNLAEQFAEERFVVLAPDLYGGRTAATIEDAERLLNTLDQSEGIETEIAALDYLLNHSAVAGSNIGAVGFSMGAAYATWLSAIRPEPKALVMFYGGAELYGGSEQGEDFATHTQAAFLGHFAENDPYESAELMKQSESQLKAAGKEATFHVYPGTGHWFFESDRPDAYNAEAARLAWERTVEFLHSQLKPTIKFSSHDVGEWPKDLTFRREDIYD